MRKTRPKSASLAGLLTRLGIILLLIGVATSVASLQPAPALANPPAELLAAPPKPTKQAKNDGDRDDKGQQHDRGQQQGNKGDEHEKNNDKGKGDEDDQQTPSTTATTETTPTAETTPTTGARSDTVPGGKNPGAIWTTRADCGTEQQDVNHYAVGEHVFINGANFAPGTYQWSIEGQPGHASGDPGVVVASSTFTVGESGAFCFDAYTVQQDDWGEYHVKFGNKGDNYRVDRAEPTATPTQTTEPVPTVTPTETAVPEETPTATETPAEETPTPSETATPSETPAPSGTATPSETPASGQTATPTATPVPDQTSVPTATPTPTQTTVNDQGATPTATSQPPASLVVEVQAPAPTPTVAPSPTPTLIVEVLGPPALPEAGALPLVNVAGLVGLAIIIAGLASRRLTR